MPSETFISKKIKACSMNPQAALGCWSNAVMAFRIVKLLIIVLVALLYTRYITTATSSLLIARYKEVWVRWLGTTSVLDALGSILQQLALSFLLVRLWKYIESRIRERGSDVWTSQARHLKTAASSSRSLEDILGDIKTYRERLGR
jgi:hypothetical protein